MNEVEMLCKDAFAISSRLFDHKAVVKAEAKYLVRELETKRQKEGLKHFHAIIDESEKTMTQIPECVDLLNERIEKLHTLIVTAASKALDILSDRSFDENSVREEYKKKRDNECELFMSEMNKAKTDMLQKHEERMTNLEKEIKERNNK